MALSEGEGPSLISRLGGEARRDVTDLMMQLAQSDNPANRKNLEQQIQAVLASQGISGLDLSQHSTDQGTQVHLGPAPR